MGGLGAGVKSAVFTEATGLGALTGTGCSGVQPIKEVVSMMLHAIFLYNCFIKYHPIIQLIAQIRFS